MADRTSAALFGRIFWHLAFDISFIDINTFAEWLYDMADSGDYDFTPDQMECHDALMALGVRAYIDEYDHYEDEDDDAD